MRQSLLSMCLLHRISSKLYTWILSRTLTAFISWNSCSFAVSFSLAVALVKFLPHSIPMEYRWRCMSFILLLLLNKIGLLSLSSLLKLPLIVDSGRDDNSNPIVSRINFQFPLFYLFFRQKFAKEMTLYS